MNETDLITTVLREDNAESKTESDAKRSSQMTSTKIRQRLMHKMQRIKIADIIVASRKRLLNENKVRELAESIRVSGLLHPVVVTSDYLLVAGAHRLAACQRLAMTEISATIISNDAALKELAEIEKNLTRHSLTALERCFQLKRKKELHEALFPQTGRGKYDRHKTQIKSKLIEKAEKPDDSSSATINDNPVAYESGLSFAANASREAKVTTRTIQREVAVAANLAPEVIETIRLLPIANRTHQLYELSRFSAVEQAEIVELMLTKQESFFTAAQQVKRKRAALFAEDAAFEQNSVCVVPEMESSEGFVKNVASSAADKQAQLKRLFQNIREIAEFHFSANFDDISSIAKWEVDTTLNFEATLPEKRFFKLFAAFLFNCYHIDFTQELLPDEGGGEYEEAAEVFKPSENAVKIHLPRDDSYRFNERAAHEQKSKADSDELPQPALFG